MRMFGWALDYIVEGTASPTFFWTMLQLALSHFVQARIWYRFPETWVNASPISPSVVGFAPAYSLTNGNELVLVLVVCPRYRVAFLWLMVVLRRPPAAGSY